MKRQWNFLLNFSDLSVLKEGKWRYFMIHPVISPVVALVSGIIILVWPGLLNIIVAAYLIIVGILGLVGTV